MTLIGASLNRGSKQREVKAAQNRDAIREGAIGLVLEHEGQSDHNRHFTPLAPMVQHYERIIQDAGTVFIPQVIRLMNSLTKNMQTQLLFYELQL